MEEKDKAKEEIEQKNNEIQQLSLQQEDFIDQLSNANEEIMSLRSKNEKIRNDLNFERKINKRLRNDLNSKKETQWKNNEIPSRRESIESTEWVKSL